MCSCDGFGFTILSGSKLVTCIECDKYKSMEDLVLDIRNAFGHLMNLSKVENHCQNNNLVNFDDVKTMALCHHRTVYNDHDVCSDCVDQAMNTEESVTDADDEDDNCIVMKRSHKNLFEMIEAVISMGNFLNERRSM